MEHVSATLNYLAPGSKRNRLYVAPGNHKSTTQYDPRTVAIGDGRSCPDTFTLNRAGFELRRHRSAVTDFGDPGELDGPYTAEVAALVTALTGADRIVSLGWMLRRAAQDQHGRRGALPPAPDVHVDLHDARWARRYAHVHARSALPRPGEYRRAIWTSLWRAFSPPPQDWPLTLCDYRSLDDAEGEPNLLFRVPEIPGPEAEPGFEDADAESAASVFAYRPAHRWWYFPGMDAGETLLIKLHDTDHDVAWRAPHTAFRDESAKDAHPRESVEFRTVAFFC
jgi:hypothetical protein